jgi:hypothetical protein
MSWKTENERPGFFGKKRKQIHNEYNKKYGVYSWRLVWSVNNMIYQFNDAIQLYEDAYYRYFLDNKGNLLSLVERASDVYDNDESNVISGYQYGIQETDSNHYQDVAVRRCVMRFGKKFNGDKLIQIRHNSKDDIGKLLSPGNVQFHMPQLIIRPYLEGWWNDNTVECFWQSNKVLQTIN